MWTKGIVGHANKILSKTLTSNSYLKQRVTATIKQTNEADVISYLFSQINHKGRILVWFTDDSKCPKPA